MFWILGIIAAGLIIWDISMRSPSHGHGVSRGSDSVFDEEYEESKFLGRGHCDDY